MHLFSTGRSGKLALLGGVSLIAIQGLSACSKQAETTPIAQNFQPPVTVPVAPVDGHGNTVAQPYQPPTNSGIVTTLAVGEEDGSGPFPVEPDGGIGDGAGPPPFATTLAIGEEDGQSYTPAPGTPTTLALGEEDGSAFPKDPDDVTTLAIGEEDNAYIPYNPGTVTTLAIGEEDGSGPIPVEPDGGIGDGAGPPTFATTLALGEEDGSSYGSAF